MEILQLDLKQYRGSGLFFEEYICLLLIYHGINPELYIFQDTHLFSNLSEEGYIKKIEGRWQLRGKAEEIFENSEESINFDEFWDAFPATTPKGRALRAANKLWTGIYTKDYVVCKKKYLSKVKSKASHDKIVQIVKSRVDSGDYEYMNNMETYINQEVWQRDIKYLDNNKDWATTRA